jgi:zinc protease
MTRIPFLLLAAVVIVIPPPTERPGAPGGPFPGSLRGPERRRPMTPAAPPVTAPLTCVRSPGSPLVALRFTFRVGSQDDPPGKEGLAALTAEVVARGGSRGITSDQILDRFYPVAASLSADCRKEVTVFAGVIHHNAIPQYVPLVGAILTVPRFDPDDFEWIRAAALARIAPLPTQDDEELARSVLEAGVYSHHPYGHPVAGTVAGLRAITLDDVKEFFRAHYTRDALLLGIAGDVAQRDIDYVRMHLGMMSSAPSQPVTLPPAGPAAGLAVILIQRPAGSGPTTLTLGFPVTLTPHDDDLAALAVAQSYLERRWRSSDELAASPPETDDDPSTLVADADRGEPPTLLDAADPRRQRLFAIAIPPRSTALAAAALRDALDDLDRLAREGLSDAEFAAAREVLLHATRLRAQSLAWRLADAMEAAFQWHQDPGEAERRLTQLTAAGFNAAVRRHLAPAGIRVSVVTAEPEEFASALRSDVTMPSPRQTGFSLKDARLSVSSVSDLFAK